MPKPRISIKTTSLCQGFCNDCSVRKWMNYYSNYHASLEEIEKFIYYSKKSGYHFQFIRLTGGEPLLWRHLVDGTKLLKEAGIADGIQLYSNAFTLNKNTENAIGETVEMLDTIILSEYFGNEEACKKFKETFPEANINIMNHKYRYVSPATPIENSLPAKCRCLTLSLDHGVVDICAPARTIVIRMGWDLKDFPRISSELRENYLDVWEPGERENQELCKYCIANARICDRLKLVECRTGSYNERR